MKPIEWRAPTKKQVKPNNPAKRLVPLKETGQKWKAQPAMAVPTDRYADGAKGLAQIKARLKELL